MKYKNLVWVAAAALTCTSAFAGTFVPITAPSGSISSSVIGINDRGEVAGSFSTDGIDSVGFVGSIDGNYQTFDVNGHWTQPRSVNNQGLVVGFYRPDGLLIEFSRQPDGSVDDITRDGTALIGIAQGINAAGKFVGDYVREPGSVPLRGGFIGRNAVYEADIDLPFPTVRVAPRGINAQGDIAGWFVANPGEGAQGFLIKDGVTTVLVFPGPNVVETYVEGINNKGQLSGNWYDTSGNSHGFVLDSDLVTWTSIDVPSGGQTQAFQINNLGQVVVNDLASNAMYIYCPGSAGICADRPNAHVNANELVTTGQTLYAPAQGQLAPGSGAAKHVGSQLQ